MKNHADSRVPGPTDSSSSPNSGPSTETVISLARDIWRLRKELLRTKNQGMSVPEGLSDITDRLWDDLEVARIRFVDPKGQAHDPGARYEVAFIEGEGDGPLFVAETLLPGIQSDGVLIASPTVVLSRGGKS